MTQILPKRHLIVKMLRGKFDVINVLPLSLSPTLIKHKKADPVAYIEAMSNKRVVSTKFSPLKRNL